MRADGGLCQFAQIGGRLSNLLGLHFATPSDRSSFRPSIKSRTQGSGQHETWLVAGERRALWGRGSREVRFCWLELFPFRRVSRPAELPVRPLLTSFEFGDGAGIDWVLGLSKPV
jgi:hypothetical protein